MNLKVQHFYDKATFTLTYIVFDADTKDALIIDPVLDFDQASGKVSFESMKHLLSFIEKENLNIHYALETHAHADHLTSALYLKEKIKNLKVGIGESITKVQEIFKGVFNLEDLDTNGSQFDLLLKDQEVIDAGSIKIKTLHTPGHTPACSTYQIENMIFTGDLLFMPDYGTGRCDFPAGDAHHLYSSVKNKIYNLPDETIIYVGHDYQPNNRELLFKTSVGESKKMNIHLKETTTENEYVEFRTNRDRNLSAPKLLLPSIQVNIDAGKLPLAESNSVSYLKLPLKIVKE